MRFLILAAIRAYQRYLSPYKGYCCAYRTHTGRRSCSVLGFRAVRRYGALPGLALLRRRMRLCGEVYRRYAEPLPRMRPPHGQRGECDPGCDLPCDGGCDLPDTKKCTASPGDCLNCDFPDWRRKKERGLSIHIPPRARGQRGKSR